MNWNSIEVAKRLLYSTFMGFVLKYYLISSYKLYLNWEKVSLTINEKYIYVLMLIYFFMNCIRYLFGFYTFGSMQSTFFENSQLHWKWANLKENIQRKFILHVSLFLVIVFGCCSLFLFPEGINASDKIKFNDLILTFILFHIFITVLDIISVSIFKRISLNNDQIDKTILKGWISSGKIEIIFFFFLLLINTNSGISNITFLNHQLDIPKINIVCFILLLILLILEYFDLYNYPFNLFNYLKNKINHLKKIKIFKKDDNED